MSRRLLSLLLLGLLGLGLASIGLPEEDKKPTLSLYDGDDDDAALPASPDQDVNFGYDDLALVSLAVLPKPEVRRTPLVLQSLGVSHFRPLLTPPTRAPPDR